MAKQIILNREVVNSEWQYIYADRADLSGIAKDVKVFVNYEQWLAQKENYHYIAPVIADSDDLLNIVSNILEQPEIGLHFDNLKSGIGYSNARMLRENYNYKGNIHALGRVSRDHLCFMERCGINAFHLADEDNLEDALGYFADIDVTYQR